MAFPISSFSWCCSRSCSLGFLQSVSVLFLHHKYSEGVHCHVDILHGHLAVNLLHGLSGILHRDKGFLVDVCGFDGVDLLLEHGDLAVGLFEGLLVLLFALEGVFGRCAASNISLHPLSNSSRLLQASSATSVCILDAERCRPTIRTTYRSYSLIHYPSLSCPAAPSGFLSAFHVSAAYRAAAAGRGWLSWGHLFAFGPFARRTMSPTYWTVRAVRKMRNPQREMFSSARRRILIVGCRIL